MKSIPGCESNDWISESMAHASVLRGPGWAFVGLASLSLWAQDETLVLTGVARDFAELLPQETEGHPDFNPNWDPQGWENWGCFDKPDAAKGAIQNRLSVADANPDAIPDLIPYDRDEAAPLLKPGFDNPPNCFRSRFDEWYTTRTPDINRAFFVDLTFRKEGNVYKYDSREFFPLNDDKIPSLKPQIPSVTTTFGHRQTGIKDGIDLASRNYGFTFELHAHFTYKRNSGQVFQFEGDDDVWVFINDSLVMDLGGIHSSEFGAVNIDALGLTDGKNYNLDFYYAERRIVHSRLTITTSLELKNTDEPLDPPPVQVTDAWLYDRNGDGIADSATYALDQPTDQVPTALTLNLAGESAQGNWNIRGPADTAGPQIYAITSNGQFFTQVVSGWDESLPANRGVAAAEPATGLLPGTFPQHDRIGPVIVQAIKTVLDTSLLQVPTPRVVIRFSEPVQVDASTVLRFLNEKGEEVSVTFTAFRADSLVNGTSVQWSFDISPASPVFPGTGFQVAIGGISQVADPLGNTAHPGNPFRPLEAQLPRITIGDLRAENPLTHSTTVDPTWVNNPFVLLTSVPAGDVKTYTPLHPETAEPWVTAGGPTDPKSLIVFEFKLSHPAAFSLAVYDNLGQFVHKTALTITREDLLSGKLARDSETRAYLVRFGWYPKSTDGNLISTGAYILRSEFQYGLDPRDAVEPGRSVDLTRFGFIRQGGVRGLGNP